MTYMLIDPPVSPLSSPSRIQAWLDELAVWAEDPQNCDPTVQKQIQGAIDEAREWLAEAAVLRASGTLKPQHRL